jgi:hypothetical protein
MSTDAVGTTPSVRLPLLISTEYRGKRRADAR